MKLRVLGLSILLLSTVVGCSRPDQRAGVDDAAGGDPVSGDWAILRFEGEPDVLNPALSTNTYATYIEYGMQNSHVFELLMQYDPANWTFTKPLLAESYPEISEDRLTYTFTIREGVRWHDGEPFTAEDVLFSAKAMMSPLVDSAPLRSYFGDLTNVQLLDGRKVQFTLAKPNFMNVINLGSNLPIVPKHIFDPEGALDSVSYADIVGSQGPSDVVRRFSEQFNRHAANRAPIGTGPYKFEKWEAGSELVLARNDDYWGTKGYLDKIVYRFIQDYTGALTALKSGDVDMNHRLLPLQYAQQTSGEQFDSQFTKTAYSIPAYSYIGWNMERPYFKDKRVRQALTMLVDRRQIIETVRFGLGTPTESHFNPNSPEYNKDLKPIPYDPGRAAQLLDEAGWKDTNGDGVRDKDGVPFRFEFLASTASTIAPQLLPILKEEFRKVGIDMTERTLEFTVFTENLRDHRFDAATGGWTSGLVSDPYQLWHSTSAEDRGSNFVSFKNPEADRLLEQARLEFDDAKRGELYRRWQEIIYDEQPYTFLYVNQEAAAWEKRFRNVEWFPPRPGYDISQWFVPTSLQKYTNVN